MSEVEQIPPLAGDMLRRLQLTELELLIEFDRICRKNQIRYSIIGGKGLSHGMMMHMSRCCVLIMMRLSGHVNMTWTRADSIFKITFRQRDIDGVMESCAGKTPHLSVRHPMISPMNRGYTLMLCH